MQKLGKESIYSTLPDENVEGDASFIRVLLSLTSRGRKKFFLIIVLDDRRLPLCHAKVEGEGLLQH